MSKRRNIFASNGNNKCRVASSSPSNNIDDDNNGSNNIIVIYFNSDDNGHYGNTYGDNSDSSDDETSNDCNNGTCNCNDDENDPDYSGSDSDSEDEEYEICDGPNCDHKKNSTSVPEIPQRLIDIEDNYKITLKDLIDLGASYHCKKQTTFRRIDLSQLVKLYKPLLKLYEMIGMNEIKENYAEQIVYFLLDLEPNPAELLHTILTGPPGVGKSHIIDILAEIYLNMGYLTKNIIHKVKISDLKGKYIGHTAPLTQKAINTAMGGVLVIDEVYSLGSEERLDSFSKEIIDTLNQNLTEKAGKFVCIIAGYEKQIETCLLAHNPGLKSRFRFRFNIEKYEYTDLLKIFMLKLRQSGWDISDEKDNEDIEKLFEKHYPIFKHYGRDMETLVFHSKISHSNRVFFSDNATINTITIDDIKAGIARFKVHNSIKDVKTDISTSMMYL